MANQNRPLSPHLQVYRPQITSFLSILHRATGVVLAIGALFFTYWLLAATYGPAKFAAAQALFGSLIGQLVLWGFTFSVFYHLANGIRHLAWDAGWGFELDQLKMSGIAVLVVSVVLPIGSSCLAYAVGG